MAIYHVAKNGTDDNVGTENQPFLTINHAAQIALPGDTVMVHQGVYREWVDPKNAGLNDRQRITYQAVAGDHVVLKGSEVVKDWQPVTKGIWKTVVDNKLFGDYNPFAVKLDGDWLEQGNDCHAGDLYVNHHSFYEAHSYEKMATADERKTVTDYVTGIRSADRHAARTKYRWFAEVSDQTTTIYANFHELDPKQALVEISVRKCCFYPRHTGINYVTLSGFEICQAATPWAPPTTEQIGMVGPHWAKGWQIKDNELHDAKCCAISIGCPKLGDDNAYNQRHDKPGYQYQLERIFNASRHGWSADTVGAHEIAHNTIYNCGQCAIVGNMGCIFSRIVDNRIFEIGTKYEFGGWEIAAIKFHAPIDTEISQNKIDHCILGTWLDWEAQGTKIDRNLYHHNLRDLLIEMCHGPLLVVNNVFASKRAIDEYAQGTAFINNLIAGQNTIQSVLNRATPYHLPHSTAIKGYAMVYGGDDRYYNNIFIKPKDESLVSGTSLYNGSPTTMRDYISQIEKRMPGDVELFETVRQPTYIDHNVHLQGAKRFSKEKSFVENAELNTHFEIKQNEDSVSMTFEMPSNLASAKAQPISADQLGKLRIVDAKFESADSKPLQFNNDYFGNPFNDTGAMGPFAGLKPGTNHFQI